MKYNLGWYREQIRPYLQAQIGAVLFLGILFLTQNQSQAAQKVADAKNADDGVCIILLGGILKQMLLYQRPVKKEG